jgi:hypothetical protein
MAVYEVDQRMLTQCLEYLNEGVIQGWITNTIVSGLTTAAGVVGNDTTGANNVPVGPVGAVAGNPFVGYEVDRRFAQQYSKAMQRAVAIGVLTNTNVAAASNVAGLIAVFTGVATDPTIVNNSAAANAAFMHTTVA